MSMLMLLRFYYFRHFFFLASLSAFFWVRALAFVQHALLSVLVSRLSPVSWLVSRRCSVSKWVDADATGRNEFF